MFECEFSRKSHEGEEEEIDCGMKNDESADVAWKFISGATPSENTGPTTGHSGNGYYAFAAFPLQAKHTLRKARYVLNTHFCFTLKGALRVTRVDVTCYTSEIQPNAPDDRHSGHNIRVLDHKLICCFYQVQWNIHAQTQLNKFLEIHVYFQNLS